MKYASATVLRYALFLGIFIGVKFLIDWKLVISWRDVLLAAICTIISIRQSQVAERKEKEAELKGQQLAENETPSAAISIILLADTSKPGHMGVIAFQDKVSYEFKRDD